MKSNSSFLTIGVVLSSFLASCSSTTVVQEQPVLPDVPDYVKVPHPINFELSSLKSIFYHPLAPEGVQGEFSKACDADFQKLASSTDSKEEHQKAAHELVSVDPEKMHWCFYSKISRLQDDLQSDATWSERQKKVFQAYSFLAPIANAFQENYRDSRYLRWAAQYYTKISEWVFFRKVRPLPDSTLAIVMGANASILEPWVQVGKPKEAHDSVFTKYGISLLGVNSETTVQQPEEPSFPAEQSPIEVAPRSPSSKDEGQQQDSLY